MSRYRLTDIEHALSAVSRAADLAANHLRRTDDSLDRLIPDLSLEGARGRTLMGKRVLELLDTVDDERLPHDWALTSKLLRHYAESWSLEEEHYWLAIDPTGSMFYAPFAQTPYALGYLMGSVNSLLSAYEFNDDGDVDRYLVLLTDITRMLRQIRERTNGQAQRGIRMHKPQLPAARAMLGQLKATALSTYPVAVSRLTGISEADAVSAEIRRRVVRLVADGFVPLIDQLDADYESQAPDGVGMNELPGGEKTYAWLLKLHTTRDLTAEEVHTAGRARMARIEAEMADVRRELGFNGSPVEFALHLGQHPRARAASADDIGERMRRHRDRVESRFDEFFHRRPSAGYDVARLAPALEDSMTWGYYEPPTRAEKRGIYHYNGGKMDSLSVIAAASLVFHELLPGHHLHLTLQTDSKTLPPLRRNASVNAFNEAWAEYAATLAGEMGLYDDPYDRYGRLCMDAFLTSRLVVDTGMNALGWTWAEAKDYLREHTLCAKAEIESDTLRYSCGIPAQSLAYKLGDEAVLRMRDGVRERMGSRFDERDFHAAILDVGALPLPALEWHLERVFTGDGSS
ncbi:DUF885 domain-containing protein [Lentzea sp. NPDC058436]|uniref:DUF885 domain-containing protein n=1 Tax=Lentzea sp. NPDC058436 TaxID=3346499 RepID=UPI003651E47B